MAALDTDSLENRVAFVVGAFVEVEPDAVEIYWDPLREIAGVLGMASGDLSGDLCEIWTDQVEKAISETIKAAIAKGLATDASLIG